MMSFTLENPLSPYFIGITLAVYLVTASTLFIVLYINWHRFSWDLRCRRLFYPVLLLRDHDLMFLRLRGL